MVQQERATFTMMQADYVVEVIIDDVRGRF